MLDIKSLKIESLSGPGLFFGVAVAGCIASSIGNELVRYRKPTTSDGKYAKRAMLRKKLSFKDSTPFEDVDTIIIGSGTGGMSCAAVLSRLGYKVLVLEKHDDVAGGSTHMFDVGGYTFDSGLHYTVPWSTPILALTCGKPEKECLPFDLMGDGDATVDKICLSSDSNRHESDNCPVTAPQFNMKYRETHFAQLYKDFPDEHKAIEEYVKVSDMSMVFVKIFLFARLLPKWLQTIYWRCVPKCYVDVASVTAETLLPTLTSNRKLISLLSSMWIDTGAPPDKASFMMTASVFRGLSMEGAAYPRGGSEAIASELTTTIEQNGGALFIRADVTSILVENNRACGVCVNGKEVHAKRVVSSIGYLNTFKKLVPEASCAIAGIPRQLSVAQSAGFVMVNIGIQASPESLGLTCTNTWHIPTNADGDLFPPMKSFFANPLGEPVGSLTAPCFITFPSLKDRSKEEPSKVTAQILIMAHYDWFNVPQSEYQALKASWKERAMVTFYHYYPQTRPFVEVVDVSTPRSIERWLTADEGCAVGIDVTPKRFVDPVVRRRLDCVTDIPGLYLTGQDTVVVGVTLSQLSGVITAIRMEGFWTAIRLVGISLLQGLVM